MQKRLRTPVPESSILRGSVSPWCELCLPEVSAGTQTTRSHGRETREIVTRALDGAGIRLYYRIDKINNGQLSLFVFLIVAPSGQRIPFFPTLESRVPVDPCICG